MNEYVQGIYNLITAQGFFMLGAKGSLVYDNKENSLRFKPKGSPTCNYIKITYDYARDLYNIEMFKYRTVNFEMKKSNVKEFNGLYVDQVREIIERETGLYLSMNFKIIRK
jgi:hypothetical protein